METTEALKGLALHSTIEADGTFRIGLDRTEIAHPHSGEMVVRIEAAPINPSDLGLLLGAVDLASLHRVGSGDSAVLKGLIPSESLPAMKARIDQILPVGNEGAGTVIVAGAGCEHLLGRTVAVHGGAMYAQYRTLGVDQCMLLPAGTMAAQGASAFVNPVTALGMVETLKLEGHKALVHTAAASNLGQMLVKLSRAEGIPLVNIVRSEEQARLLKDIGAIHICNSTKESFMSDLVTAIGATGATLAFDATGGGTLANDILTAMERSLVARNETFSRYGSSVHKQIYLYGGLDPRPLSLSRTFGMAWSVGGWLLTNFLGKIGKERAEQLRMRAAAEITTTFASHYFAEISLADMLEPEIVRNFSKRATGEKFLLNPSLSLTR
jgi:NADPH:quinone reductase